MKITHKYIISVFNYNQHTGELSFKKRPSHHFKSKSAHTNWNNNKAGSILNYVGNHGYIELSLDYKKHLAHRVIWLIVHGELPNEIDHVNGNKTDNRLLNLKNVTRSQNCKNLPIHRKNKIGITGLRMRGSSYEVYISSGGKTYWLGSTRDFFEACCKRKSEENKLGFSPNHGRKLC